MHLGFAAIFQIETYETDQIENRSGYSFLKSQWKEDIDTSNLSNTIYWLINRGSFKTIGQTQQMFYIGKCLKFLLKCCSAFFLQIVFFIDSNFAILLRQNQTKGKASLKIVK